MPPGPASLYGPGQAGPEDEQVPGECAGPTGHHQWGGAAGQDGVFQIKEGELKGGAGGGLELGGPVGGALVGEGASTEGGELLTHPRYCRKS